MKKGNSKTKILIVEDEGVIVGAVTDYFERKGFVVISALDGETGLAKISADKPDLILLDIQIPKLNGLNLCGIVRRNPKLANIPIIILTASSGEVDKIVALEFGADDYVVKPFSLGELLARVRAVLRRAHSHVLSDNLVFGNLVVNIPGRKIHKSKVEIKLSRKEFDLLVELMRNNNMILSRDLILTRVWGFDNFIDKQTVDVHIHWLRKKLEEDASNPQLIVTAHGIGYRFVG